MSEIDLCVLTVCDSKKEWVGTTDLLLVISWKDGFVVSRAGFVGFGMGTNLRICGFAVWLSNVSLVSIHNVSVVAATGD